MAMKAKHAFGSSSGVEAAIQSKKIDAFDILFLDGDTDQPKIGWVDKNGNPVILKDEKADLSEVEADIETLEAEVAKKANAEEVNAELASKADATEVNEKFDKVVTDSKAYTDKKVEAAISEHLVKKYEFTDVPEGTIVDYREDEIRVMCPVDAVFTKQNVGEGGDANNYYATLKTYVFDDNVVGYIEHLNGVSDKEILTDLKTDNYGRRYQPTWFALANYADGAWNYYGKSSTTERYIGWNYQIDWYNADGKIIGSDTIRISLSNEDCHFVNEPYYVGSMMKNIDTKIEEKIAEVEAAYEVIEF